MIEAGVTEHNATQTVTRHQVAVCSVGLLAPGLDSWRDAVAQFCEGRAFEARPLPPPALDMLPRNERRRSTFTIRLALEASQQAMDAGGADVARMRTVFACSGGDTETLDRICTALTRPGRPVSPAQFHKSVHNAPAGYRSIACASHAASTSICAFDASFSAGLLEAFTIALDGGGPVLLVAYDVPPPQALHPFRPLRAPFAMALLLDRASAPVRGFQLGIELLPPDGALGGVAMTQDSMADAALEDLRLGNPAGRSLPLLERLALGQCGRVLLPYIDDALLAVDLATPE